jgi:peptide/nickel transport system permease protein
LKFKPRIWHLLILSWLVIIIFRAELLLNLILLWVKYFSLLVSEFANAIHILDFNLFDALLSIKLFLIIPVLLYAFRKRLSWLKNSINFSYTVIVLLMMSFIFALVITDENPNFQKNLKATKLLAPFSTVVILNLNKDEISQGTSLEEFINYKNNVLKPSYNESIVIANSVKIMSDHIIYSQKGVEKKITLSALWVNNGVPDITSKTYILGTDEFGRDIFARIIYGTRISLLVGISAVMVSLIIGLFLGFIAGFKGGVIDIIFSRLTDLFLAFPIIYLIVLILALFGNSITSVIIVLGLSGWMSLFKIVKSEVLSEKNKDYILTAGMLGLTKRKILTNEILPVIFIPLVVSIVFQFSNVILAESALSYLGLGTGSSYPSWGAMIESGQRYVTKAWWMISFPGLILIFTIFSANDFGKRLNRSINPGVSK